MSVDILYDYEYTVGSIYELRYNGLSNKKSQWYMVYSGRQYRLRFIDMTESTRTLHHTKFGKVFLDFDKNELTFNVKDNERTFSVTKVGLKN